MMMLRLEAEVQTTTTKPQLCFHITNNEEQVSCCCPDSHQKWPHAHFLFRLESK